MIDKDSYKIISDALADIQDRGQDIVDSLVDMNQDLSNSNVSDNDATKVQLEGYTESAIGVANRKHVKFSPEILDTVKKLQLLVEDNDQPINNFLNTNNILVKCTFANMSFFVGFPINISNIEDVEYCELIG